MVDQPSRGPLDWYRTPSPVAFVVEVAEEAEGEGGVRFDDVEFGGEVAGVGGEGGGGVEGGEDVQGFGAGEDDLVGGHASNVKGLFTYVKSALYIRSERCNTPTMATTTIATATKAYTTAVDKIDALEKSLHHARRLRANSIRAMRDTGMPWADIQELTGLTRQRLNQLVREFPADT